MILQISRQKLSKDWHRKLQAIKAKAAEAAEDLPPPLALPEKTLVDYAAVKYIRDKLAETADKTFFGNLTGPAGLWDKILRAYEKDSTPPASCLPLSLFYVLALPKHGCTCKFCDGKLHTETRYSHRYLPWRGWAAAGAQH